ncbi:MAG: hypothetical protein ACE5NM_05865 [Sedimentisphaerales bacterium]
MARRVSQGKCNLCGGTFSKQAMTKHIKSCKQKEVACDTPAKQSSRKTETFHIVVEGRFLHDYWLHLEVPSSITLAMLDSFLRQTWLECCGHMSAFTIEGQVYSVAPMSEFDDKSMNVKLRRVLKPGMKFYHEYDFGSTTHLTLKVVSQQQSEVTGNSICVLARNEPPKILCVYCGKIATQLCTECLYSDEGWLCDECAAEHECDEDMLLPVVNSPRVGTCGYTGD